MCFLRTLHKPIKFNYGLNYRPTCVIEITNVQLSFKRTYGAQSIISREFVVMILVYTQTYCSLDYFWTPVAEIMEEEFEYLFEDEFDALRELDDGM